MFSVKRLDTIRKIKCAMDMAAARAILNHSSLSKEDFEPVEPRFFVRFNKDTGQVEIVK